MAKKGECLHPTPHGECAFDLADKLEATAQSFWMKQELLRHQRPQVRPEMPPSQR